MADTTLRNLGEFIAPFRVAPGRRVRLVRDFDPAFKGHYLKKRDGEELLQRGVALLTDYQARLAAQDTWGVLVVLQALDAAGKDGTVRHVMSGVNPQGVAVFELQGALARRARPRLPVALREALAGARRDRHLQPFALRRGPRGARAPRAAGGATAAQGCDGRDVWKRRYREINDWEHCSQTTA